MRTKMFQQFLEYVKQKYVLLCSSCEIRKDVCERKHIAKAFNNRYTYRHEYDPYKMSGGNYSLNAWMCPECNMIHRPIEFYGIAGLQYPTCCSSLKGPRLNVGIKTK
jgi:hypothetical protein